MSRPDVHLSDDTIEQALLKRSEFVRQAFELLDLDGGGSLAVTELQAVCSVIGLKLSFEEVQDIVHEYDTDCSEVQDIVHEYDTDCSGDIEANEFVELVLRHAPSPEQEMRESWKYFDVDKDGCIDKGEVKAGLARVGIELAPWELREMMETADTDGDHLISFEEYAAAYGTGPWLRAQGVCGLMSKIMHTWKILDKDGSGNIDVEELVQALVPMGSSREEIDKMVKTADRDGDGQICFKEFLAAYHTDSWFKVRLMSIADEIIGGGLASQRKMYKMQEMEEEDGAFEMTRELRMKRRGLRRSKEVRVAINEFWKAIEYHTIGRYWVPKALYYTYNIKLNKAVFVDEEDWLEDPELLEMAEDDWKLDLKRNATTTGTQTPEMIARVQRGLAPFDPKPDGVQAIPYGVFFESLFELTDAWMSQTGEVEAQKYGDYVTDLLSRIITECTDDTGQCSYRWVNNSDSLVGKDEEWPLLKQAKSIFEKGGNLKEMQGITSTVHATAPQQPHNSNHQTEPGGEEETGWFRKVADQKCRNVWRNALKLVNQNLVTAELVNDFQKLKMLLELVSKSSSDGVSGEEARVMVIKLSEMLTMCSKGGPDVQEQIEAAMHEIGKQIESMGGSGDSEAFVELKGCWSGLTKTLGKHCARTVLQQTSIMNALQSTAQEGAAYEVEELVMANRRKSISTVAEKDAVMDVMAELVDDFQKLKLLLDGVSGEEALELVAKLSEMLAMCSKGGPDVQDQCEAAMHDIGEMLESMGASGKHEAFAELKECWSGLTKTLGVANALQLMRSSYEQLQPVKVSYEELATRHRRASSTSRRLNNADKASKEHCSKEDPILDHAAILSQTSTDADGWDISHNFQEPTRVKEITASEQAAIHWFPQATAVSFDTADPQFSLIMQPSEHHLDLYAHRLRDTASMCGTLSWSFTEQKEPRLECAARVLLELASRLSGTKPVRSHIAGTSNAVTATCRLLRSLEMPLEAESLLALWARAIATISEGRRADDGFVLWEMKLAESSNEQKKRPQASNKLHGVLDHSHTDPMKQVAHSGRLHRPKEMVVPRMRSKQKALYQSFGAAGAAMQVSSQLCWPGGASGQSQLITTQRTFSGSILPATLSPQSEAVFATAASTRLRNRFHPLPFSTSVLAQKASLPILPRPGTVPSQASRQPSWLMESIVGPHNNNNNRHRKRCATSHSSSNRRRQPKSKYYISKTLLSRAPPRHRRSSCGMHAAACDRSELHGLRATS